ncbi:MAG: type II toxin-antitoxin system VapC family toxin [Solirubrobacteraceae bacterium]
MVIVDANVLLYAVDQSSIHHHDALRWLDGCLAGNEAVGLAWVVLLAFLRIATSASIYPHPMSADDAGGQLETWLAAPAAVVVDPTPRHASLLRGLLLDTPTAGNLTTDAHLAALALEHRADIISYDRDFERFPGVRHRLPG